MAITGYVVILIFGVTFFGVVWGIIGAKRMKQNASNRMKNFLHPEKPDIKDPKALNDWLEQDKRKADFMERIASATKKLSAQSKNESGGLNE